MKLNQLISELQRIQNERGGQLSINALITDMSKGYASTTWQGTIDEIRVSHQYPDQIELFFSKKLEIKSLD